MLTIAIFPNVDKPQAPEVLRRIKIGRASCRERV